MSKRIIIAILASLMGVVTFIGTIFMVLALTGNVSFLKNSITITTDSYEKEYDGVSIDKELYSVTGKLYDGDRVALEFFDDAINVGTYTAYFEAKIYNSTGKDVTESYQINKNYGTIVISKRELTIQVESKEEEYNGLELKASDYEITKGSLADGDTMDATITGSITEIGEAKASLIYSIYRTLDGKKINVSSNYKVYTEDGILTKSAIPLTIKSDGGSYEYDGKYHSVDTYTTPYLKESLDDTDTNHTEHLADGDTISYTSITNEKNVGKYMNEFEVQILDKDGNDVSKNYAIDMQFGEISILRKEITVVSESVEKDYDDITYVAEGNSNYTLDGLLAEGDLLKVHFTQVATAAGTYDNTFYTTITDSDGKVTSSNYIVNHVYGSIKIYPRPISIETKDQYKIYDGTPLKNTEDAKISTQTPLLQGHTLVAVFSDGIIDAGEIENSCSITIKNAQGNDVTRNYQLTLDFGKLTVYKRNITLRASSFSKAEDGIPIVSNSWYLVSGRMADYEYLDVTVTPETTLLTPGTTRNIITYNIVNSSGQILTQAQDNYNIETINGLLTIYEAQNKQVYLAPKDVYSKYVNDEVTIMPTEIIGFDYYQAQGYSIEYVLSGTQAGIGISVSSIIKESIHIKDSSNVDVTNQFTIDDEHLFTGILQIYEDEINITTPSLEVEYDGYSHETHLAPTITGADNLEIDYEIIGSRKNVGTSMNEIKINGVYDITDSTHLNNLIDHYYIHTTLGTIKVIGKAITVTTPSVTDSISNVSSISGAIDESSLDLADNHHIAQSVVTLDYVGTKENAITIIILDENDCDVTYNYDITYNYGTLTLNI